MGREVVDCDNEINNSARVGSGASFTAKRSVKERTNIASNEAQIFGLMCGTYRVSLLQQLEVDERPVSKVLCFRLDANAGIGQGAHRFILILLVEMRDRIVLSSTQLHRQQLVGCRQ